MTRKHVWRVVNRCHVGYTGGARTPLRTDMARSGVQNPRSLDHQGHPRTPGVRPTLQDTIAHGDTMHQRHFAVALW